MTLNDDKILILCLSYSITTVKNVQDDVSILSKCPKIGNVLNFVELAGLAKLKTEPIFGHLKGIKTSFLW